MRIFLIGIGLADVMKEIKKYHEIIYWSASGLNEKEQKDFPDTIFHDYYDATAARPASGVDDSQFLPPGEDLIRRMQGWETEILTMMNKKYEGMGVSERKRLYYQFLRYWDGVIKKFRPGIIIFPMAPHALYDFVLYGLADLYKIPKVLFDFTSINSRILVNNDYRSGCPDLVEEINKNKDKNISLSDLSSDIREYYLEQISGKADLPPAYLKKNIDEYSLFKNWFRIKLNMVLVSIKDLSFIIKAFNYIVKKLKSDLRDEYRRVQITPDLDKKFVFVALHYQPECATSPLGGVFVDQILLIEILSVALPDGWVIYVKEHPLQWHPRGTNFTSYRYRGFYEQIAKIKNVFIVPTEVSGYELTRKSQVIATVTGSLGWDGILRNKPAIIFGYAWYRECLGVFKVTDVVSCSEAFRKILQNNAVKQEDVVKYLFSLDRASVRGYMEHCYYSNSKISPQENKENFLAAFLKEIEKIKSNGR